jgi:hypothetical protein
MIKLTKRQIECLKEINQMEVNNTAIFYETHPAPFKRSSHSFYTDFNFSVKTFDKLKQLNLIEHKSIYSSGFGNYRSEVILTKLGKEFLADL